MKNLVWILLFPLWLTAADRLVVFAAGQSPHSAKLQLWEEDKLVAEYEAAVGRNGIAAAGAKREGDGKTPSGVYPISAFFGKTVVMGTRIPFQATSKTLHCVDDSDSCYYNRLVESRELSPNIQHYNSHEEMLRDDGLYDLGAVIDYNPEGRPGLGSCIFLHIMRDDGGPTAGCVALKRSDLQALVARLKTQEKITIEIRAP